MKILTIFTGGTIGSKSDGEKIGLDANGYRLIDITVEKYNLEGINFNTLEPYFILSENMTVEYWNKLIAAIRKVDKQQYDGIIITHGTDTLGFTANLIAMLFGNAGIPIVFVSSGHNLDDPRANGIFNMKAAIDFIKTKINGVFVCFRQEGKDIVHLGSRLLQSQTFQDDFHSIQDVPFGYLIDGSFSYNKHLKNVAVSNLEKAASLIEAYPDIQLNSQVLLLTPYIGFSYESISTKGISAILQSTYHSGTFCMNDDFSIFLERCKENQIPIFLAPISREYAKTPYASTYEAGQEGVISLDNISKEAAYCKLLILTQLYSGEELKKQAKEILFFESF